MSKADRYNFCNKCDENERNEYGERCMSCVPMLELCQALKLQELVKEKLKELQGEDLGGDWVMVRQGLLESIIEKSQTTLKEEGLRGRK